MRNYWPLGVFVLILAAILGMSQYADSSKRKYEESHRQTKTAPVAKNEDRKPGHNTEETYKPPTWGKYVTFPEGFGAWAIFFTLIAIVWQAIETRKAAETSIKQFAIQRETLSPRIVISNFTNNVFTEAMRGDWVIICMKLSNSGGLPAYGVTAETWTEFITGERPYRFSSNARYRKAAPINVDTATPQAFEIPLNRRLTEVERQQMGNAKGRIAFRIRLTYTVFDKEVTTDHPYTVRPDAMEPIHESPNAT